MKKFFENMQNQTALFFKTTCFATFLLFSLSGNMKAQEQSLPAIHISTDAQSQTESNSVSGSRNADSTPQNNSAPQADSMNQTQGTSEPQTVSEQTVYDIPVETASFNGITPGKTSLAELHKSFGEPVGIQKDGAGKGIDIEEYQMEGFKGVAFHIINNTVYGVIAELSQTINARKLADDLGMAHIQSVFMIDENGTIKGEIFPEIGVALAYDPSQKLGNVNQLEQGSENIPMDVLQIIFQTVSADPFLLRAETWVDADPKRAHGDIRQALKLEPQNQKALAYLKVLEEAVPELKNGGTPVSSNAKNNLSGSIDQKSPNSQTATEETPADTESGSPSESKPEEKIHAAAPAQTANQTKTNSSNNSSLTQLDPPDLDLLENNSEEISTNLEPIHSPEKSKQPDSSNISAPQISSNSKTELKMETVQDEELLPDIPQKSSESEISSSHSDQGADATDAGLPPISDAIPEELPLPNSLESNAFTPPTEELSETISTDLQEGSLRGIPTRRNASLEIPNELLGEFDSINSNSQAETTEINTELSFEDELFEKVEYLAKNQRSEQALELLAEIRKKYLDNPFVSFRANLVEGDILILDKKNNLEQAFFCHRRAAEQGEKLLEVGKVIRGRMYPLTDSEKLTVQELLLNAQLGIAGDVAAGLWDLKVQNTRKWLTKAQLLMDEIFKTQESKRPKEARQLRYETLFRTLTILCSLGKDAQFADYVKAFLAENLIVLKQTESSQEYIDVCMNSSLILDDVSQICILRNEMDTAQKCLNRAIAMMEQIKKSKKELSINETFLLSQLYYHKGMIFSLMASNENELGKTSPAEQNRKKETLHQEAVVWYDKSIPYLTDVIKKKEWKDPLQLGKIVNGMSVSYTETGNTKKAYVLLKTAIFCIEQHVDTHPNDRNQLRTPYQNMLQLLEFMGRTEEMNEFRQKLKGISL